jgi:hypothetical protein
VISMKRLMMRSCDAGAWSFSMSGLGFGFDFDLKG